MSVKGQDLVPCLQAGLRRGSAFGHLHDVNPVVHLLQRDTQQRPGGHGAVFDQLLQHIHRIADGDRKAQSLDTRSRLLRIHDTDQVARSVEQAAAGVARVDRRIGLEQHHGFVVDHDLPVQGGNDSGGDRTAKGSQRVADGDRRRPDFQVIGVAEGRRLEILCIHLDDRQVRRGIGPHQLCIVFRAVGRAHRNGPGAFDDMVVRDDVAVAGHDDTRAGALGDILPEQGIAAGDGFRGDFHHCRPDSVHDIRDIHGFHAAGGRGRTLGDVHAGLAFGRFGCFHGQKAAAVAGCTTQQGRTQKDEDPLSGGGFLPEPGRLIVLIHTKFLSLLLYTDLF